MKGRGGELEVEEEGGGALRTISMTRGQGGGAVEQNIGSSDQPSCKGEPGALKGGAQLN